MKEIRVIGQIEFRITVPNCITIEEIEEEFKEHAKSGEYYFKGIKVCKEIKDNGKQKKINLKC